MAKPNSAVSAEAQAPKVIRLRRIEDMVLVTRIEGKTPLIPHRWSEKAIRMMAEKQQQETTTSAKPQREPKNPEQEAHDSCYWLDVTDDGGNTVTKGAMPATAFKASMVGACRFYGGITMVQAKQLFYVEGSGADQLVPIDGEPVMRQDTPRNATGVADLRYRMMFYPWSATLRVRYIPTMIDPDSVLALLDAGGKGGVGDWRPSSPKSSTGTFGQFSVMEG
jgi:hypothetical protein